MGDDPDHDTSTSSSSTSSIERPSSILNTDTVKLKDAKTEMVFQFTCNFCDRYSTSRKPIIDHIKNVHNINPVNISEHFSACKRVPEPKKIIKLKPVAFKSSAPPPAQSNNPIVAVKSAAPLPQPPHSDNPVAAPLQVAPPQPQRMQPPKCNKPLCAVISEAPPPPPQSDKSVNFAISEMKEHFVCVFCPKYYTTVSNVKKHIKTAHKFQNDVTAEHYRPCVKELKQTSRVKSAAPSLAKVKPPSFVTPVKDTNKVKSKDKEVCKTNTVEATPGKEEVNHQNAAVMTNVIALQPANMEKQLKKSAKYRKSKQKSSKIKFYNGLENILLDPSKNEKFQLWKKKTIKPTSDIEFNCSDTVTSPHQSDSLSTSDVSATVGYIPPKTVWLSAIEGKGLKISGTWSFKNDVIYMDLTLSNKASQAMHGFEIQLNENSFGLVPTHPLDLPVLKAGQTVNISLPFGFGGVVIETDPLATMKFIIRNSVDVFFIACIAPLHIFFVQDGAMGDATYLDTFKAIPAANDIKYTFGNVECTLDDISHKMQQINIFTVAKCTLDGQDMIYQSIKLRNGIIGLVKITKSSEDLLTISFKSLVMKIAQAVFQVYDAILEQGALLGGFTANQSSAEIPEPVIKKQNQQPVTKEQKQQSVIEKQSQQSVIEKQWQQSVIEKQRQQSVIEKKRPQSVIEKQRQQSVIEKKKQQPVIEKQHQQQPIKIHKANTHELREPSKRGKRALIPGANGRRRVRCGLKSCKPCMYNSDCGKCMQCLNKKTMK